jgi:hypothetical protein
LRNRDKDKNYPEWSDRYPRETIGAQSNALAPGLIQTLLAAMPPAYVADPRFDFCAQAAEIGLLGELAKRDPTDRARLESWVADLMGNLGSHSRNALRGILRASNPP